MVKSVVILPCVVGRVTGLRKTYIVLVLWWERLPLECRDSILSDNFHHSSFGLFHVMVGRVKPADRY